MFHQHSDEAQAPNMSLVGSSVANSGRLVNQSLEQRQCSSEDVKDTAARSNTSGPDEVKRNNCSPPIVAKSSHGIPPERSINLVSTNDIMVACNQNRVNRIELPIVHKIDAHPDSSIGSAVGFAGGVTEKQVSRPVEQNQITDSVAKVAKKQVQQEFNGCTKIRYPCVKVNVTAPPLFQPKPKRRKNKCSQNSSKTSNANSHYAPKAAPYSSTLNGPCHLIASCLPAAFPEHLAFRALAIYSTIRTLSVDLRISPFTPNAFLRALSLPTHCRLIGDIHAAILRILFASYDLGVYHYRGDGLSRLKLPPKRENDGVSEYMARRETQHSKAGENLLYLDHLTWPLYLRDFAHIVEADTTDGELDSHLLWSNEMHHFFKSRPSKIVQKQINIAEKKSRYDGSDCFSPYDVNGVRNKTSPVDHDPLPAGPNLYQPFPSHSNNLHEYAHKNPCYYPFPNQGAGLNIPYSPNIQSANPNPSVSFKGQGNVMPYSHYSVNHGQPPNNFFSIQSELVKNNIVNTSIPNLLQSELMQNKLQKTSSARDPNGNQTLDNAKIETTNIGQLGFYDKRKYPDSNQANCNKCHEAEVEENINEYTELFDAVENYLGRKNTVDLVTPKQSGIKRPRKISSNISDEDDSDHGNSDNESESKHSKKAKLENPTKLKMLKKLADDTPYFKFSILTKVEILEYLIDEILGIEIIRQKLDARHNLGYIRSAIYGKLPTSEELSNIANEDICKICELEGDLICCDGCTASYHRECMNTPLSNIMTSEKWFCHECKIIDGSFYGPLDGGYKESLDWFSLKDLEDRDRRHFGNQLHSSIYHSENDKSHNISTEEKKIEKSYADIFDNIEFLIVHGYVFARSMRTKSKVTIDIKSFSSYQPHTPTSSVQLKYEEQLSITSLQETRSISPLNKTELYMFLVLLGPSRCTEWPWTQIPFNPEKTEEDWIRFGHNSNDLSTKKKLQLENSKQRYYDFIKKNDAFNPFSYNNSYQRSTNHHLVDLQIGKKKLKLDANVLNMDNSLRYELTSDMSDDKHLALCLKNGMIDLCEPIREYMVCLEKQLFKSSLLSEIWGLRNKSGDLDWWSKRVKRCKSMKVLSKLLVSLIDETDSRAFSTEWCMLPGTSNDDLNIPISDTPRNYTALSPHWIAKDAMFRRRLERCREFDMLKLIGHVSHETDRKGRKVARDACKTNGTNARPESYATEKKLSVGESSYERSPRKTKKEENKNRRKSDRYHQIIHPSTCSNDELIVDKLYKMEKQFSDIDAMESHWPIAGRKLFEPCGSLPKPIVKWLGRNAGVRYAPYVRYPSKFEIGLPSFSNIWRKNTLDVTTLERFIYQITVLDSYLNRNAINSLDSLTRRVGQLKGIIQKVVKCAQIDIRTGTMEYFVIHRTKQRGCWLSSDIVEGSTFVLHKTSRIQKLREKRIQKLRYEEESRRLRAKKKRDEARRKAARKINKKESSPRSDIDSALSFILKNHEEKVKQLMKECKENGLSVVPTSIIKPWRDKHFVQMQSVTNSANKAIYDDNYLSNRISQAELYGTNAYIIDLSQAIKDSRISKKEEAPLSVLKTNGVPTSLPVNVSASAAIKFSHKNVQNHTLEFKQKDPVPTSVPNRHAQHNSSYLKGKDLQHKVLRRQKDKQELEQRKIGNDIRMNQLKRQRIQNEIEQQKIGNELRMRQLEQQRIQNEMEQRKHKQLQVQQEIESQRLRERQLQMEPVEQSGPVVPPSELNSLQRLHIKLPTGSNNMRDAHLNPYDYASKHKLRHPQQVPQGFNNVGLLGQSRPYPYGVNPQQDFNSASAATLSQMTNPHSYGLPYGSGISSFSSSLPYNGDVSSFSPSLKNGNEVDTFKSAPTTDAYTALLETLQRGANGSQVLSRNGGNQKSAASNAYLTLQQGNGSSNIPQCQQHSYFNNKEFQS